MFEDDDLGITDDDERRLVFMDGVDYWETRIMEPNIEELSLCYQTFKEENA